MTSSGFHASFLSAPLAGASFLSKSLAALFRAACFGGDLLSWARTAHREANAIANNVSPEKRKIVNRKFPIRIRFVLCEKFLIQITEVVPLHISSPNA